MTSDPLGGIGPPPDPTPPRPPATGAPGNRGDPRAALARLRHGTPTTWILCFVLACFFIAQSWLGNWDSDDPLALFRMGALHWVAVLDGDIWRLAAYSFLHIGVAHFLLNTWALWIFMRPIEVSYGATSALGIYAMGVLAGGAASAFWAWHANNPFLFAAGASAGIAAIFGAQISLWARVRTRLPPEASRAAIRALLINLGLNVVISWQAAANGLALDNAGHLGGILSGMLFGLLAPLAVLPRRPWSRPAQLVLIVACFAVFSLEGAAVARAVHPHTRLLRSNGIIADAPWMLVPAVDGVAVSPGGIGLEARIYRSDRPLELGESKDAARMGDRTWVREKTQGPEGEDRLMLSAADGAGTLRVEVLCAAPPCHGELLEATAAQLARTLRLDSQLR